MSYKHPWPHPYPGLTKLPPSDVKRLTVEVPLSDFNTCVTVALDQRILISIAQYAIKTTAEEIRKSNLTHADQRAFIDHICKRAFEKFVKEACQRNDGGGVTGVHNGVEEPSHSATELGKKVTEGGRGRGGRGGGGGTGKGGDGVKGTRSA